LGEARPPEPRKAQNELPDAFWEPFGHRGPEQLKSSLERPSESHVATRVQNALPSLALVAQWLPSCPQTGDFWSFNLLKWPASFQRKKSWSV